VRAKGRSAGPAGRETPQQESAEGAVLAAAGERGGTVRMGKDANIKPQCGDRLFAGVA